jgi:hypothetical protein
MSADRQRGASAMEAHVSDQQRQEVPTYLTASDLTRICDVDLKTIHNWCEKRGLPHFRTPGRHLRFRPDEVVPWIGKFGYPIPAHLKKYLPVEAPKAVVSGA